MVWKKPDDNPPHPEPAPAPARPAATPPAEPRRGDRATATIGPSIFINGDLSGDEDLVIEGRVEGKIDLKQHNVTIGRNGRVRADVFGNTVIVEGEVDGNLFALQQAILRQSGAVRGNITAPRVMLEDGSRFRGSIDMESAKEPAKPAASPQAAHQAAPPTPHGTATSGLAAPAAASAAGAAQQHQPAGAARGSTPGS
jgi:cytoskeletal protein CcmA (bactofilin family)